MCSYAYGIVCVVDKSIKWREVDWFSCSCPWLSFHLLYLPCFLLILRTSRLSLHLFPLLFFLWLDSVCTECFRRHSPDHGHRDGWRTSLPSEQRSQLLCLAVHVQRATRREAADQPTDSFPVLPQPQQDLAVLPFAADLPLTHGEMHLYLHTDPSRPQRLHHWGLHSQGWQVKEGRANSLSSVCPWWHCGFVRVVLLMGQPWVLYGKKRELSRYVMAHFYVGYCSEWTLMLKN